VAVSLAMAYPQAKTIYLVMDNLNIHRRKALADVFGAEMAPESGIGSLSTTCPPTEVGSIRRRSKSESFRDNAHLGNRRIPDLETLRREAKAWNRRMNRSRVKIAWRFDRKTARRKFGYKSKSLKSENRERTVRGLRFARVLRGRERR